MAFVVRQGDSAVGHTDIEGNPVTGTVGSGVQTVKNGGVPVATSATVVTFPSHAHALSKGTPIDFRSHTVAISASGKNRAGGNNIALDGDTVPVADEAGPDATVGASTTTLRCKQA